eukprot:4113901-Pleurochrysis_carterae.AAC.3
MQRSRAGAQEAHAEALVVGTDGVVGVGDAVLVSGAEGAHWTVAANGGSASAQGTREGGSVREGASVSTSHIEQREAGAAGDDVGSRVPLLSSLRAAPAPAPERWRGRRAMQSARGGVGVQLTPVIMRERWGGRMRGWG